MPYKGDTLCLLPQEKEICVKLTANETVSATSAFEVDCSMLYLSRRYSKKCWRMFISRPLSKVYILTGTSRISTEYICGNAILSVKGDNSSAYGEFYVNVPYQCTSVLTGEKEALPKLKAAFKPSRVYRAKTDCVYVTGMLTLSK